MAFYDFECHSCGSEFGVQKEELDVSQVFCVECASTDLVLTAFDEVLPTRISMLIDSMNDLADRVEGIENDIGSDAANEKDQDDTH